MGILFLVLVQNKILPFLYLGLQQEIPVLFARNTLHACEKFRKLKRSKRVNFSSTERRYFWYLEQGHVVRDCDAARGCSADGCCDPSYHTLLHKEKKNVSVSEELVCLAMEEIASKRCPKRPYFMTLPVRVRCGEHEALTYGSNAKITDSREISLKHLWNC